MTEQSREQRRTNRSDEGIEAVARVHIARVLGKRTTELLPDEWCPLYDAIAAMLGRERERLARVEAALAESEAARVGLRNAVTLYTEGHRFGAPRDDLRAWFRGLGVALDTTPSALAAQVRARHRAEAFRDAAQSLRGECDWLTPSARKNAADWLRALADDAEKGGGR